MPIGKNCLSSAALLFSSLFIASANAQDARNDRTVETMLVTARVVATCKIAVQVASVGSVERNHGGGGSFKVECTKGAAVALGDRGAGASGLHMASRISDVPLDLDDGTPGRRVATVLF